MSLDYSKEDVVVEGNPPLAELDRLISHPLDTKPSKKFYIALAFTSTLMLIGIVFIGITFYFGIGVWGNNDTISWGFAITNFVFWVGIAHAGSFTSAILYLLRQSWRSAIARIAETITVFALIVVGLFPLIHLGRPWLAGYLFPYPSEMGIWPNFLSPLVWDFFAVSTYALVSAMFWYIGLIPDFAILRDRTAKKIKKMIYRFFSLGWRHSNRHWLHYNKAYLILAGLLTPLVLSVHSVVGMDFAAAIVPGWHSTIFPPYFVAGAIYSGVAMAVTVLVFLRKVFDMENIFTLNHLDKMNKLILVTGSMVGYAYLMEAFISWYSGVPTELYAMVNRAFGAYAWGYWTLITCNVIIPQFFWSRKIRRSIPAMLIIVILVNVGMWVERYTIIVSSLSRSFLPSSWSYFTPSPIDIGILIGSFGIFFTFLLIYTKTLPVVAMSEIKAEIIGAQPSQLGRNNG